MKKITFLFLTAIAVLSCENNADNVIHPVSNTSISSSSPESFDTITSETKETDNQLINSNKVEINFVKNKDLLDIILLLPETDFSSWGWKLEDRIKWYNEIKLNNYYVDNDPNFFTQKYFESNKAGFTIVDGFWSINIYKTAENSYIVITDDVVGDGNDLNFYEVKANKIKSHLNEVLIFNDYRKLLMKKDLDVNCDELFETLNDPIFNFDFSQKNKIEIESSWYLTEEDYKDCLHGNSITSKFNPLTKKFDVEKIYWKQKQK